jgi:phage-related protein (TIGR01555 family)
MSMNHRHDSWYSRAIGLGTQSDGLAAARYLSSYALTQVEQDALMDTNAIARRIASLMPEDATRQGIILTAPDCDVPAMETHADRCGVFASLRAAMIYARAYGGSVIIALTKDGAKLPSGETDYSKPLVRASIESLQGFLVLDRWDCSVSEWQYDPRSPIGLIPTRYNVSPMYGLPTSQVHHSRVMPMIGVDAPPRVRIQRYSYWGPSVFDLCYEDLRNYQVTGEYVGRLVMQSSVSVLQSKYLSDAILSGNAEAARTRIEALQESMSALNMLQLDKDNEAFSFAGRPMSGIGDAQTVQKERLIAATGYPMSILFGQSQGGLNSGENSGEIRTYYAHVASEQEARCRGPLDWMLSLAFAAQDGPLGGKRAEWSFEFRPLWEPDEATKAATRKANAEARAIDLNSAFISTDEVRANDPTILVDYPDLDPMAPAASDSPLGWMLGAGPSALPGGALPPSGAGAAGGADLDAELPTTDDLPPDGEATVSISQAAETLGLPKSSVRGWVRSGDVRAWRVGGRYRVLASEVRSAMAGARVTAFGPAEEQAP